MKKSRERPGGTNSQRHERMCYIHRRHIFETKGVEFVTTGLMRWGDDDVMMREGDLVVVGRRHQNIHKTEGGATSYRTTIRQVLYVP